MNKAKIITLTNQLIESMSESSRTDSDNDFLVKVKEAITDEEYMDEIDEEEDPDEKHYCDVCDCYFEEECSYIGDLGYDYTYACDECKETLNAER